MMAFQHVLSLLMGVIHAINSQTLPTYVITAPSQVHPLSTYSVLASLHNANSPITVKATVSGGSGESVSGGVTVSPGESTEIKLKIGDWKSASQLLVEGSGAVTFSETRSLSFNPKGSSVFIQTDKAIYQPGQKIQFRVFVIDSKLKPIASQLTTYITDPQGNRVKQYLNSSLEKGVFGGDLQLSDRPLLGNWNIKTIVGSIEENKIVSVEEYVLPTYEVTVTSPPFAIYNETSVAIRVEAKYTFGKPVQGSVTLYVTDNCQTQRTSECLDRPNITATLGTNGQVVIPLDLSKIRFPQYQYQYQTALTLLAVVTEDLTGNTMNDTVYLTIYPQKEKLTVVSIPDTFRPGLPLKIEVTLSDQDNKPLMNVNAPVTITLTFSVYTDGASTFAIQQVLPVPPNGIIPLYIYPNTDCVSIQVEAKYNSVQSAPLSISAVGSLSKMFITVLLNNEEKSLLVGDTATFTINATFSINRLYYEIISKGDIVDSKMLQFPPVNTYTFPLALTHAMTPRSRILVYVVTDKREILVDSINYHVEGFFLTPVKLQATPSETQPGSPVHVVVSTNPLATAYLLGIDQSVLLLRSGNDITQDEVEKEFLKYETVATPAPFEPIGPILLGRSIAIWRPRIKDVPWTFQEAGLLFITNGDYYRIPPPPPPPFRFPGPCGVDRTCIMGGGGGGPLAIKNGFPVPSLVALLPVAAAINPAPAQPTAPAPNVNSEIKVRKYFPETFIWEKVVAGSDGNANFNTTAPDTTTSWVITSMVMDENTGMGIAYPTAKVIVSKPFFVSLNLPYSVVRGETLLLQCLVFNYLKNAVEVNVTLFNENGDFTFADNPPDEKSRTTIVKMNADESASVIFPVVTKAVGYIKIKVSAITINPNTAGDIIQRELLSKPEGITKYFNRAVLVDLRQSPTFSLSVPIEVPSDIVPDSKRVEVSVIGDIMGPTIKNIDSLLKMPSGCGEQNMINFVPNIVVADYLTALGELTAERKTKSISNMQSGYQRELTFKHRDGSYSAFGERDQYGSTWLTAYVVLSFHQCKPYITVSDGIINQGLQFLQGKQNSDGTFIESGNVIHKELQGGSTGSGQSMVAYIAIAILEIGNPQYSSVAASAIKALEQRLPNVIGTYELALITYALHLANSPSKDTAFEKLKSLARTDGGFTYWNASSLPKTSSYETSSIVSLNVEATSYCLLIYANRNLLGEAMPIVRWLVEQRNEFGGFASTQDTVVGLRALSKIARMAGSVKIDFKYNGATKSFSVNKDNVLLLQQDVLPADTTQVEISATGDGACIAQVTWSYNIFNMKMYNTFSINATIDSKTAYSYTLTVCVLYSPSPQYGDSSNMAIIQLNSLSGYTFDKPIQSTADKIEYALGGTQSNLYYYKISNSITCVTFATIKGCEVNNLKEAEVKVYDYYQPGNTAKTGYVI